MDLISNSPQGGLTTQWSNRRSRSNNVVVCLVKGLVIKIVRTSSAVVRCAVVRFAALHCSSLAMLAVDFSRVYRHIVPTYHLQPAGRSTIYRALPDLQALAPI